MPTNSVAGQTKAFGMTNQMLLEDLGRIGSQFGVDLGQKPSVNAGVVEEKYYPQFEAAVRKEAATMAKHYEVFYCLEKSIRALVSGTLETAEKTDRC
jgi:hypothetical protein